jgi:class 3 adenylate cyclase/CheY-like chemotaxis protein
VKTSLKHELRTPLNHIIGYCEMLMEETPDHAREAWLPDLERIHAAGKRLLAVINDLFDPAKADALRHDPRRLDHELRTPLNQIIGYSEMLQEDAREQKLETFLADLDRIHAAAHRLLQLVVEHFVPLEGVAAQPMVIASGDATTFLLRTSAARARERAAAVQAMTPGPTGSLLVVDDDEANRSMLARRLVRLGHRVALAENGRAALQQIRSAPFDLLLLDIQMPELNGYEVLEQLKADPSLRALPVIVLSASSETDRVAHCIEMGAEDYLPKPFDPVLLQARISACLEKKRLRDREAAYLRQIEEEKRRSDELLRVILPHDVAEELKATNAVKPRRFENVAVLFCDIVGFTAWCDRHSPEEALTHLQALVESFEKLAAEHGLEKIKTIGDSFMATAGLLAPLPNPALACVRCGLAMIVAARTLPANWQVRVGVHVGPVIAGVVGRRKYQYDVWGDTVNLAARMEEAAQPGSVCVSAEAWRGLAPHCRGRSLGAVSVRGKGELELILVESASSPGQGEP